MRGPRPGRGFTLVEGLIAGVLVLGVLGIAWQAARLGTLQAAQVLRYSDALQAATSIHARMHTDFSAVYVPPGVDLNSPSISVGADGRSMAIFRSRPVEDLASVPAVGAGRVLVRWFLEPGADGQDVLVRQVTGGERTRWEGVPIEAAQFRLAKFSGRLHLVAELVFGAQARAGERRRALPLRVVTQLRGGATLSPRALRDFPTDLLGDPNQDVDLASIPAVITMDTGAP